jgi:chemotaxis protein CheX
MAAKAKRLTLPAGLDAAAVEALHADLAAARGRDVRLAAAEVRRLGALGAQLLLAAARAWAEDGRRFSLEAPSDEFLDALRLLGLRREALEHGGDA